MGAATTEVMNDVHHRPSPANREERTHEREPNGGEMIAQSGSIATEAGSQPSNPVREPNEQDPGDDLCASGQNPSSYEPSLVVPADEPTREDVDLNESCDRYGSDDGEEDPQEAKAQCGDLSCVHGAPLSA